MAEFDRSNPLFERNVVPFEVVTSSSNQGNNHGNTLAQPTSASSSSSNKRQGNFTVRILQGQRRNNNGGGDRERVIRFEMSDECNLICDSSESHAGMNAGQQSTPCRGNTPIIHAPFMTADRGQGQSMMMQGCPSSHQSPSTSSRSGFRGLHPKESMSSTVDNLNLYELEVGESDFADLRRDQALLVDFNGFANSLISLLQFCELGEEGSSQNTSHQTFQGDANQYGQQPSTMMGGWSGHTSNMGQHQWGNNDNGTWNTPSHHTQHAVLEQHALNQQQRQGMQNLGPRVSSPYGKMNTAMPVSTYACRLEIDASSDDSTQWRKAHQQSNNLMHARFSIVESNQFRELTHLALNLNVGTDKSVRCYLSARLSQTMLQNRSIQNLYAEQQRRSETAETNLISLNKRLQDLTQSTEAEKLKIRYQAEERLQTESCSRLAEANEIKTSKDAEIKALNERYDKNRAILESKIDVLTSANSKLNAEKMASENENERLATKLSYTETTNNTLSNELSTLRSQFQNVSEEKSSIEKSLHQLQLQLSSLEYSSNNQERTISQAEAQRISLEKVSEDAKQTLSRQQIQLEELRRKLTEAELETSKYKDLTSRYQTNRLEMKKRIKEKVEMIREQEDVLVVKEKELTELKSRVRGLEEDLQRAQTEKAVMSRGLSDAKQQAEDDKKKLENNQQVIAWLNKQANKASVGGATWQGGMASVNSNSKNVSTFPTSVTANSQAPAALSRFLPYNVGGATTPYQRSYVTPDIKPSATSGVPKLHPEPTPYSSIPQRPA